MRKSLRKFIGYFFDLERIDNIRYAIRFHLLVKEKYQKPLAPISKSIVPKKGDKRILVPLIETNHYGIIHSLSLAKALQIRGGQVKVLVCDGTLSGCEIKSVKNEHLKNPCFKCKFNIKNIVRLFGLETINFSDYLSDDTMKKIEFEVDQITDAGGTSLIIDGIDLKQCIEDSILRYYYGAVPSDKEIEGVTRKKHLRTALISLEFAKSIDSIWNPDLVLNNMSVYSSWSPLFKYFNKKGENIFQVVTMTPFDYKKVIINPDSLYKSSARYKNYCLLRKDKDLNSNEKNILNQFISRRVSGTNPQFNDFGGWFDQNVDKESLVNRLKIDRKKKNIFLFSNIYWDVGISDYGRLYEGVIEWVLDTIKICKNNNDLHLYIKTHPAEIFDSSSSIKGIHQIIKDNYPILPKNLTIISPNDKISPYGLFEFIDLGVIFNGTIGLEMMLGGIPIITTGRTVFGESNLCEEPKTRQNYASLITQMEPHKTPSDNQVQLFAYFYFIKTLIPWNLNKIAYKGSIQDGLNYKTIKSLDANKNKYLDHVCKYLLNPEELGIDNWD